MSVICSMYTAGRDLSPITPYQFNMQFLKVTLFCGGGDKDGWCPAHECTICTFLMGVARIDGKVSQRPVSGQGITRNSELGIV